MLGLTLHQTNGETIAHLKYLEEEGEGGKRGAGARYSVFHGGVKCLKQGLASLAEVDFIRWRV